MRGVHGAGGRRAALFVLGADADGAGAEDHDDRRAGERGREVVAGAAGRGGRTRVPVRVLYAGVRDGGDGIPEDESESDAARTGARRVGQSVPLPRLRQDSHSAHAWRGTHTDGFNLGLWTLGFSLLGVRAGQEPKAQSLKPGEIVWQ